MKRRDFLKNVGCGAMGSTTLLSTLASLGSINGLMANSRTTEPDYKALVCVLLNGGMDSFNMLIPTGTGGGDTGFNDYLGVRTDLAIQDVNSLHSLSVDQLVSVRGIQSAYQSFGLHPQMPELAQLFNTGKLAIMANIGTLVEPLYTFTDYQNNNKKRPLGIYSHSDQMMQWQTSVPQSREALGFGGRLADLLQAGNSNQSLSMNISLGGKNLFQRGKDVTEYSIRNDISPSNVGFESFSRFWSNSGFLTQIRNEAVDSMVAQTYQNALKSTFSSSTKASIDAFGVFKEALQKVPSFTTPIPNSNLARDLLAVAKVMSVQKELGAKRQIFFVNYGGWDMHDNLVSGLNERLPVVSQALSAFYNLTTELNLANQVTTFTISDFARTITSNGQGSDHGWGGNSIVMGGAVNGKRIFGAYPLMDIVNNPRNISFRGNFIPAVSTDELYAELALWYGVSPSDLCYSLPNLGNFYSYSPSNYPLGLMNLSGGVSTVNLPQTCINY